MTKNLDWFVQFLKYTFWSGGQYWLHEKFLNWLFLHSFRSTLFFWPGGSCDRPFECVEAERWSAAPTNDGTPLHKADSLGCQNWNTKSNIAFDKIRFDINLTETSSLGDQEEHAGLKGCFPRAWGEWENLWTWGAQDRQGGHISALILVMTKNIPRTKGPPGPHWERVGGIVYSRHY